jgi:CRISPR-associated exonuclease Cas4
MGAKFTVSDLRQFEYCQRVVYFTHCMGLSRRRPATYKMQEGKLAHEAVAELEERRSLRNYGLAEGERRFNVPLYSEQLEISGLLDMLIITEDEAIPVEFKSSFNSEVGQNHKIQLGAYSVLIEELWQVPVSRSFIYFIPLKEVVTVPITGNLKSFTLQRLEAVKTMIEREALPDATKYAGRCTDCEFRNFCPDVWYS